MKKYLISSGVLILAMTFVFANITKADDNQGNNDNDGGDYNFSGDLTVGSSGNDVTALQNYLIGQGYDISAISSGRTPKGYFGEMTRQALSKYQHDNDLPNSGYFGKLTRGKIKDKHNNRGASLRVTSPNGGETWVRNSTQAITWTGSPGILAKSGSIWLQPYQPPCTLSTVFRCMIAVHVPYPITTGIALNAKSFSWTPWPICSGATPTQGCDFPDGQYKIKICSNDSNTCDTSDNYFNITSSGTNNSGAPTISGVDAPTTLAVNQTGTWTIHASDAANGNLSYEVNWGDFSQGYAGINSANPFVQTSTFTHSYQNAGTYTVTITVKGSSGQTAQTSSTVQVGNTTSAGPLQITSPNGGENWVIGTVHNITWTSPYYIRATTVDLRVSQYFGNGCTTNPYSGSYQLTCNGQATSVYTIATGIGANQNSYSWNVGFVNTHEGPTTGFVANMTLPAGTYYMQLCESGTNNCDTSNGSFTITSSISVNPDLSFTSPHGGETWNKSSYQSLSWNGPTPVDIKLVPYYNCLYGQPCSTTSISSVQTIASNINANTYSWHVGYVSQDNTNAHTVPDGSYKIIVCKAGTDSCSSSNSITVQSMNYSDINILSPNGGESYSIGGSLPITWQVDGGTQAQYEVKLTLSNGALIGYVPASQGQFNWSIPTYVNTQNGGANVALTPGQYKVHADLYDAMPCTGPYPCSIPAHVIANDDTDGFITIH